MSTTNAFKICCTSLIVVTLFASTPLSAAETQESATRVVMQSEPEIKAGTMRTVLLAVTINGLAVEDGIQFMSDTQSNTQSNTRSNPLTRVLAPPVFLQSHHVRLVDSAMEVIDGDDYYDLAKIPGLTFSWNRQTEVLSILAVADVFSNNKLNVGAAGTGGNINAPGLYAPGAFFNYDLDLTRSAGAVTKHGLFEVGMFRETGLLTSSFRFQERHLTRLMTTYSIDDTDKFKTLKIGDAVNHAGSWGRALLYGGIQYSTNFSIRPDFISVAMPSISGKAILPSTVDVYVNNALRSRQQVDAGPFSIQNLPLITGTGEVQLVVKDPLGREQVITQNFFASPQLLRAGLVEDAYDFGWVRKNYASASNAYVNPFFTANYKKGLSDTWTGEVRLEVQKKIVSAGFSLATVLPAINSSLEANLVASRDSTRLDGTSARAGAGTSASAIWSYLGRKWSANAKLQLNTPAFRQLGSDHAHLLQRQATVQLNVPIGRGVLGLNYFQQKNYAASSVRLLNLAYSLSVNKQIFASALAVKTIGDAPSLFIGFGLTFIIDAQHFASTNLRLSRETKALYADVQKSTPRDRGMGYRLAAQLGAGQARQEASLTIKQSYGVLQADIVNQSGAVSTRVGAQGGINYLDGDLYFSRGFVDAFAVVKTEGMIGIPIYLENQEVARTNQQGKAIVSNLQSYQKNRISIDPLSLPMEASLEKMEKTVVPRYRGGVLVDFLVQTVRAATLVLQLENGEPLPTWSRVTVNGLEHEFVSGKRGEVYVEFLQKKNIHLSVTMEDGRQCEVVLDLPDNAEIIPFLDNIICRAVKKP